MSTNASDMPASYSSSRRHTHRGAGTRIRHMTRKASQRKAR